MWIWSAYKPRKILLAGVLDSGLGGRGWNKEIPALSYFTLGLARGCFGAAKTTLSQVYDTIILRQSTYIMSAE